MVLRLLLRRTCSDQERKEHETVENESHDGGWTARAVVIAVNFDFERCYRQSAL
jgi:hypothetical protein